MTDVLERVYTPRGAALDVINARDNEVLVSGPAGTGKSRACLEKLHHVALANPGMRGLIVRKTAASLTSTALATWKQFVIPESLARGHVEYYGGSAEEPAQYRYQNGSKILIGGMDKPTKIMSSEYDIIFAQEATELTITDWEHLTTRLRHGRVSFQQLMADCNPDRPDHWLKQRCDSGTCKILYARHEDNPVLFDASGNLTDEGREYIGRLDNLTGVRLQRLRHGRWVAAEGVIYEGFDPTVHLVGKPKDPPEEWRRIWTVDFGFKHPFVCQMWAVNPDGRAYRYREFFGTETLVEDWARQILASVTRSDGTWKEPRPEKIICDHDAEDRATLEKHLGMPTVAAKKTVSDGIQATQVRIRDQRLFLVRDALVSRDPKLVDAGRPTCTEEEIGGYVWNETKDQPVKEMDDGCDCMRYLVADLDLKGEVRMRWL